LSTGKNNANGLKALIIKDYKEMYGFKKYLFVCFYRQNLQICKNQSTKQERLEKSNCVINVGGYNAGGHKPLHQLNIQVLQENLFF
jgi:hypothetical protein